MAKHSTRSEAAAMLSSSSSLTDGFLFIGGAIVAILLVCILWPFINPNPNFSTILNKSTDYPPDPTFYDDPSLSYSVEEPMRGWDEKRKEWLRLHPSYAAGSSDRVLIVTGSQPSACKNPVGDHLLLRFFKNKVNYGRIHGHDVFYNNALLQPKMRSYWAKMPVLRAAMVAHPEAEWVWWVDSDAAFTDMDFELPLERYRDHNLVVYGWPHLLYQKKSWVSLNAGVFLIRNCQWAMDFLQAWASMGPQTPDYSKWAHAISATLGDRVTEEPDDQSAMVYLLVRDDTWRDKVYLESEYYFQGYWVDIVGTLDSVSEGDVGVVRRLRRRWHAEKVREGYVAPSERSDGEGRRRPFITHFTGCEPCSGDHNEMYSGESCWNGMQRALTFADNQVLRSYGFMHPDLLDSSSVSPLPFDFPA